MNQKGTLKRSCPLAHIHRMYQIQESKYIIIQKPLHWQRNNMGIGSEAKP